MSQTVTWDVKDLAVIQNLLHSISRENGRPCYEIDGDWNLEISGIPVLPGQHVTRFDDGSILISEPVYE